MRCFRVESQTCAYLYPDAAFALDMCVCVCMRVCVCVFAHMCVYACMPMLKMHNMYSDGGK